MSTRLDEVRAVATDFLNALASKRATKAYHDGVMGRAIPGTGVTKEMTDAADMTSKATVRLSASCSWDKVEILAKFVMETLEKRPCDECSGTPLSGSPSTPPSLEPAATASSS